MITFSWSNLLDIEFIFELGIISLFAFLILIQIRKMDLYLWNWAV